MPKKIARSFFAAALCVLSSVSCRFFEKTNRFPYPAEELFKVIEKKTTARGRKAYLVEGSVAGEIELVAVEDENVARALIGTEQAGVRSAFGEKINPYVGQVTSLVECDPRIAAKDYAVAFSGREAAMIVGGANARKVFGACTAEELKYIGGFFAGYDREKKHVVLARLFRPLTDFRNYPTEQEEMSRTVGRIFRGR